MSKIRGRLQIALYRLALQVCDDHMLRLQLIVVDARGLDDHKSLFAVYTARISKGVQNEPLLHELKIGF